MRASTVLIALCAAGAGVCAAQQKTASGLPDVTIAPRSSAGGERAGDRPCQRAGDLAEREAAADSQPDQVRFVLFQENRSFDFYFGSYPGADGLYAGPAGPYAAHQVQDSRRRL